ncbi:MAG: PglZ domain-containing protein [Chitinophagaceae bacterium]|nr:PglZ domain-containing protein [Chitinophagaceae bacterium]
MKLTENWIDRSKIRSIIKQLTEAGFRIFLTSDHGNIQAKGWRGLNGREKLGKNKSGSRRKDILNILKNGYQMSLWILILN